MTIDKIYNNGNLSVRSYHACKYNEINTIADLNNYYEKHRTFIYLRNCGEKSNLELTALYKKFNQKEITNDYTTFNDHQIEIINKYIKNKSFLLSNRTLNTINKYFGGNLTFKSFFETEVFTKDVFIKELSTIEKIGQKALIELNYYFSDILSFIENLKPSLDLNNKNYLSINEKYLLHKIKGLSKLQRQVINRFIKNSTALLNVRSRNAIKYYVNKTLELTTFATKIFDRNDFQVSHIKNVGRASIPEVGNYLDGIKNFIIKVINITEEKDLIILNNNYLLQNIFQIKDIPNEILQGQSIVKLCDFLISKNAFYKEDINDIFIKSMAVYNFNKNKSLGFIADELNYTRERIRQIREKCFEELDSKISFLKTFKDDLYQNYEIDINENFIILTDDKVDKINFSCNTKFSRNFLNYIFSIYLFKQFTITGNLKDVLAPKQIIIKNRHNWKNIYLLKKEIQKKIDIKKLCEDIRIRRQEKINKTYKFNFKSYLSKFLLTDDFTILESIKEYCEIIINQEFNLFLDLDKNIVFNRNTIKTAPEYAFEALEKLGKPSKVEDISKKIVDLFPNLKTNTTKVRASLKRKNGFVPVGRSSIFGLQKWESQMSNFKGGTIRSIVKEYLDNSSIPQHISKITKYVLQYRPKTNKDSIVQNLKLDKSKTFKFFENSEMGVLGKEYDSSFIVLDRKLQPIRRTWDENYKVLKDFITENNRLPFSTNCPESEKIIYRWLSTQKYKINKEILNSDKISLINKVLNEFPIIRNRSKKKRSKGSFNLDNLLEFIQLNKRLPKYKIKEEQKFYSFFYTKRKQYKNNELSDNEYDIITSILKQYPNQIKGKSSLPNRYEILLDFVKKNKRLPSTTYKNEQKLYHFFYKQRKLYEKNELDNELTTLFMSIVKEV